MSLADLRICVEKPLPSEEHVIGTMDDASHTAHHFQRLQAAFQTSKIWPKSVTEIKIQFANPAQYKINGQIVSNPGKPQWTPNQFIFGKKDSKGQPLPVDPLEKELYGNSDYEQVVQRVYMERIQPIIPFKLKFVQTGGDVRITFVEGVGSWSLIGTDCLRNPKDEVTLNYGWIDVPTIIHEFGHVLGMIHEHQNPRGNPIDWDEKKVYAWAQQTQGWDQQTTYNNIIKRYSYDQVNGSDFDPLSVMLYFFPGSLTKNNQGTQQNMRLAPLDVIWIEKTYAGGKLTPSQFYQQAYNQKIGDVPSSSLGDFGKKHKLWFIIIIVILVLILVWAIWFFLLKKKNRKGRK